MNEIETAFGNLILNSDRKNYGFGSCNSCCGSIIASPASFNFVLAGTGSVDTTMTSGTCGPSDRILLAANFDPLQIALDLYLRASGLGTTWPVDPTHTLNTTWTGTLLVTIKIDSHNNIEYDSPEIDVQLFANWNDTWPDTTSPLFARVPIHKFLSELAEDVTLKLKNLMPQLQKEVRKAKEPLGCTFIDETLATCSSGLFVPTSCAPCDICCECAMQQRCDGACAACECINCDQLQVNVVIISTMMLFASWLILP